MKSGALIERVKQLLKDELIVEITKTEERLRLKFLNGRVFYLDIK